MLVLLVLFCQNIMFYDKFIAPQSNRLSKAEKKLSEKNWKTRVLKANKEMHVWNWLSGERLTLNKY